MCTHTDIYISKQGAVYPIQAICKSLQASLTGNDITTDTRVCVCVVCVFVRVFCECVCECYVCVCVCACVL